MVVASPLRIVGQLHGRAYHPQAAARPRPEAYARFRNPGSLSVAENADRAKVSVGQAWLLQEPTDGLSADDVASKGMNQTESGLHVPFGGVARPRPSLLLLVFGSPAGCQGSIGL